MYSPNAATRPSGRRFATGLLTTLATAAVLLTPASSAAMQPVAMRSVLDVPRIDGVEVAALPDGRVLLGWTNGNNNGDTTLAMVRPAGGVLPSGYQALRTGYSADEIGFLTGGPADNPVMTYFQDAISRAPFTVALNGSIFGAQTPVFGSAPSPGRFPAWARCPNGSTVFTYQHTIPGPPQKYAVSASLADANGKPVGGTSFRADSDDPFQHPTPTCDQGIPLWASVSDPDGSGGASGDSALVTRLGLGGGTQLSRSLAAGGTISTPQARVAPDGRLWVMWTETVGGVETTRYITRAPGWTGTSASIPVALGSVGEQLFFDAAGNTHVMTSERIPGTGTWKYGIRTAPPGQSVFGPEQPLVEPVEATPRLLTGHPDGNPRVLVTKYGPGPDPQRSYELRGIPQAGSGNDVSPIGFSSNKGAPVAAFLPSGDLFMAAPHETAPDHIEIREGGLDTGAPPTLSNLQVPSLGAPGEQLPLAVDAADPLGLAEFSWSVNGQTLSDQHTTVSLPAAGTYVATARAVDRAGNVSELSRTIRILDPNALTPGTPEFTAAVVALVNAAGGSLTPPAVPDTSAPRVSAKQATRGRKGKSKRIAKVTFTANETVSVDLDLIGRIKKGKDKGTLVLKSAHVDRLEAGKKLTSKIKISSKLAKLVKNRLTVRITLTDLAGNSSETTVRVKAEKRSKKKRSKK